MTKTINENKTKSELLVEINNLKKQISDNNDFLTDIGIIQKETFMSRIEAIEENTVKNILNLINSCVEETGRDFPCIIFKTADFKKYGPFFAEEYGTSLHEQVEKWLNTNSNKG